MSDEDKALHQSQEVTPASPDNLAPPKPDEATVLGPVQQAPAFELTQPSQARISPSREPVAEGLQMKPRNPVTVWILWPLLTLGIYHFVWYYKIHREMAEFDPRRLIPVAGPMLVLLFLSWTVIAPLVSYYNTGNRIRNAQRAAGLPASCSAGIGTLLMILLGVGILYYQAELNKVSHSYGEETPPGTRVPLYA